MALSSLALVVGCEANLGPLGGGASGSPPTNGHAGTDGEPGVRDGMPGAFHAAPGGLRRLSVSEYRLSVSDLLDIEPPGVDTFQHDTPVSGFASIGSRTVAYSAQQVERFEQAAYEATSAVFDDATRRAALIGCEPTSAEDPCVREFLARFARRVFRRPATSEELDQYSTLISGVAVESDVWLGLAYAVAGFLQSPDFLYRVELGGPEADAAGSRLLSGFEIASRLSYLLTGSTPDAQLLGAAESGALESQEGLLVEFERLVGSSRSETAVLLFFQEHLELQHIGEVVKVQESFPDFSPVLATAMKREVDEVVADVAVRNPTDLLSLLSGRNTYVNGPLAQLYGLAEPAAADEWVSVTFPEDGPRAGLLGFAGLLATHSGAAETSVTKRGLYVVSNLLCRSIPSPPDGVETLLPSPPQGGHATMRERVEQHMADPSCANCHKLMDPPGLALEHFDALGRYRESDGGLPIDATGEIDGEPFDGAKELGLMLSRHPDVAACFVRRFYEFALGTQVHDGAPISEIQSDFEDAGRRYPGLVRALVQHDGFRLVSAPR